MKINVLVPILDFQDKPIKHPDGNTATFRSITTEVLSTSERKEGQRDNPYELYQLAMKINKVNFVNLDLKERNLLREKISSIPGYHVVAVGRIIDILEGKDKRALAGSAIHAVEDAEATDAPAAEEAAEVKPIKNNKKKK